MVVPAGRGAGGGLGPCRAACAALPGGCGGCPGARGELRPSVGCGGREPDGASLPARGGAGRPSSPLAACPAQAPVTRASLLTCFI